jgi:hypothetical protein
MDDGHDEGRRWTEQRGVDQLMQLPLPPAQADADGSTPGVRLGLPSAAPR